ncbi:MAG: hypothetical protein ACP5TY_10135 [Thermodesulforhabdaceae bacterium]
MEGNEQKKKYEISIIDLVNALALYKANQAGIYGTDNMSARSIGNMAGIMTDIMIAREAYKSQEITADEYKDHVKEAVVTGAVVFVETAIKVGLNVIDTVSNFIPALKPVATVARKFVDRVIDRVVEKVRETAEKVYDWGKKLFKKIFG